MAESECCRLPQLNASWKELVPDRSQPGTIRWENVICTFEALNMATACVTCTCGTAVSRKSLAALLIRYRLLPDEVYEGKGGITINDLTESFKVAWVLYSAECVSILTCTKREVPPDTMCPICLDSVFPDDPAYVHESGCRQWFHYACALRCVVNTDTKFWSGGRAVRHVKLKCPLCKVSLAPNAAAPAQSDGEDEEADAEGEVLLPHEIRDLAQTIGELIDLLQNL